MYRKFILYFTLISMYNIYCQSSNLKSDLSNIDSFCKYCSTNNLTESDEKNLCLKNKVFCDFQNMIQYIGERLMTAKRVAVAKWDTNDTIVDPIREEQILKNITKEAEDIGLDPIWAKIFFRNQIDANIYVQQNLHLKWDRTGFRPHGPAVDLVTEIRPIIDKLNKELINVSFETRFIRSTNWCHFLREISAENTRKVLIMNSIERRAFEIALRNVCLHFIR